MRIGGVSVGKVKDLSLAPDSECQKDPTTCNTTRATIEIDPQYAPISSDARAILRQKTLLGETYVELTTRQPGPARPADRSERPRRRPSTIDVGQLSGGDAPQPIPEGGHLAQTQVQDQTQIDEIFQGFDKQTRAGVPVLDAERRRSRSTAAGLDLNDAFGNLGPFASDASDVLGTLRQPGAVAAHARPRHRRRLRRPHRPRPGAGRRDRRAPTGPSARSPRRARALSDTFKIFPTFENESRLTLDRLKGFAEDARPVFHDLRPVARDLSPTLRDVRRLAPERAQAVPEPRSADQGLRAPGCPRCAASCTSCAR